MQTYLLFTTANCHKCRPFKEYVENTFKIKGTILLDTDNTPRFMELANKYGVSRAPTLILLEDGKEQERFDDLSELK